MTEDMIQKAMLCPLFRGIEPSRLCDVLREIDAVCVNVKRGEPVRMETSHTLAAVLEGRLQIVQHDYWGTRSIIHMLVPGKMIGESFTWFEGYDLHQQTLAQTDCMLMVFSRDKLLTGGFPEQKRILENLLGIYGIHQRIFLQKFHLLSRRKTRDRLLAYLSQMAADTKSAAFDLPFTRQELADYLCVERSAMCTELSALQREGILICKGRRVELLHPEQERE
ncbi:MAG: Crp/Fnr family transcriptional regulator [Clostridia bacterium]|nr:Crp/Fnr family transcriptional regulator [Clostridia bacterium]